MTVSRRPGVFGLAAAAAAAATASSEFRITRAGPTPEWKSGPKQLQPAPASRSRNATSVTAKPASKAAAPARPIAGCAKQNTATAASRSGRPRPAAAASRSLPVRRRVSSSQPAKPTTLPPAAAAKTSPKAAARACIASVVTVPPLGAAIVERFAAWIKDHKVRQSGRARQGRGRVGSARVRWARGGAGSAGRLRSKRRGRTVADAPAEAPLLSSVHRAIFVERPDLVSRAPRRSEDALAQRPPERSYVSLLREEHPARDRALDAARLELRLQPALRRQPRAHRAAPLRRTARRRAAPSRRPRGQGACAADVQGWCDRASGDPHRRANDLVPHRRRGGQLQRQVLDRGVLHRGRRARRPDAPAHEPEMGGD